MKCVCGAKNILPPSKYLHHQYFIFETVENPLETTRTYAKPSLKMLREAIESVQTLKERSVRPIWESDEATLAKLCGLR
jgi:hypothetical protein